MLTFLNSLLTWSLLAAAIPILIHLFTRKKQQKVPFSSLQFLRKMQAARIRHVRLKQILLLMLRTLILLLIALAFMRPAFQTSDLGFGSQAQTTHIIIVDNSLSMAATRNSRSALSNAQERVQAIAATATAGDELILITAAAPAALHPAFVLDAARLLPESAASLLQQTSASADLASSFELVRSALDQANGLNQMVYLVSDMQLPEIEDAQQLLQAVPDALTILPVTSKPARNISLTDLALRSQLLVPGRAVQVAVRLRNSGEQHESDRMLSLRVNGQRVAQKRVAVDAGTEATVEMSFVPESGGFRLLSAEIENDAVLPDNHRYLAFYVPERYRVLAAGHRPEDTQFVSTALSQAPGKSLELEVVKERQLVTKIFERYDALVLSNVAALDTRLSQKVQAYVRAGGGLIVFPGDDVDLRQLSEQLLQPLGIGGVTETLGQRGSETPLLRLAKSGFTHPLFEALFDETENGKRQINSPEFRFLPRLKPERGAQTILQYSNDAPFLVERRQGRGHVLAFMTSATPGWSDFVYRGLFAPLLNQGIRYVAGKEGERSETILAGQSGSANLVVEDFQGFALLKPDGTQTAIRPQARDSRLSVNFPPVRQAGFYRLMHGDSQVFVWAVNFDPQEMQHPERAAKELFADAEGVTLRVIDEADSIETALAGLRFGTELWHYFLIAALIGLLVEMLIFREKQPLEQG